MNTDVEDLLREGMERFTRDLRAPAGLTRRVVRRRRRRLALRSAAGAAAVLAAGAVVLAAGVPGAGHDGTDAAAYVVKRVSSALSAAGPGEIAQVTVTTSVAVPGGGTVAATAEEWSYGGQWRSVTDSSAGHPVYDEGFSTSSVFTVVSYQTRTWARQHELGVPAAPTPTTVPVPASGPRGCEPVVAALPLLFVPKLPGIGVSASSRPATVATALRAAVSCGTLAVAGRQRVDGMEAIELTSRPGSLISETIWVSPGTYLPVRVVVRPASGQSILQQTADITWLPPSAQNLDRLTVPIPAGFRQVPLAQAIQPNLPQAPRGLAKPTMLCPAPTGPVCKDRTGPSGSDLVHAGHLRLLLPDGQAFRLLVPDGQAPKSQ
jgi:hypothetical protein